MVESITTDQLHARMAEGPVTLVDVREVYEFTAGHVAGAVNIPLFLVPDHLGELPAGELLIICQSGNRSMQACLWLAQQGRTAINVAGGTGAWVRTGRPVESGLGLG